nr:uncharacterized protein LOC106691953 [Halyomorpha halys]
MINHTILSVVICASVLAGIIQGIDEHQPFSLRPSEVEDPQTPLKSEIIDQDDLPEMKDIVSHIGPPPPGMVRCMPGWCCRTGQDCGPFKLCYNVSTFKRIGPMIPC